MQTQCTHFQRNQECITLVKIATIDLALESFFDLLK